MKGLMHLKKLLLFLGISLIFLVGINIWFVNKHEFTKEKWINEPSSRSEIVEDLFQDYKLIGMTRKELETLLGTPEVEHPIGESEATGLSYIIGPEPGFVSIDDAWLDFHLNKDGRVTHYELTTD
jgi:hypothetical protein